MDSAAYRQIARDRLSGNWGNAILAAFLAALLGGVVTGSSVNLNVNLDQQSIDTLSAGVRQLLAYLAGIGSVLGFVHFIIGGVIRQGYCQYLLKQYDGQNPEVNDLFSQFHHFGKAFLLQLLTTLFTILWTLLFIIPGIIAGYRYSMAPFLMLEYPDLTPREALRASSNLMDGYKWNLFCLEVSFIGWAILNVFTLGIGSLWLNPYMNVSRAAFYRRITWEKRNGIY